MEKDKQKEKIGVVAWISLIVLILLVSGIFKSSEGALKILDFANLSGNYGLIGETGSNFIGQGGTGAKGGFMIAVDILPAVMLFMGLVAVCEKLGAFKAAEIVFRPILRLILGIPGSAGIAFVSSFTGSDVAAVLTRELAENGSMTDDERTIFVSYQYAGSACINNTIFAAAPILLFSPISAGIFIVVIFVCKLVGANLVRLLFRMRAKKTKKEVQ